MCTHLATVWHHVYTRHYNMTSCVHTSQQCDLMCTHLTHLDLSVSSHPKSLLSNTWMVCCGQMCIHTYQRGGVKSVVTSAGVGSTNRNLICMDRFDILNSSERIIRVHLSIIYDNLELVYKCPPWPHPFSLSVLTKETPLWHDWEPDKKRSFCFIQRDI